MRHIRGFADGAAPTCSAQGSRVRTREAGAPRNPGWYRWLLVSVGVVAADQLTKALVVQAFRPGEFKVLTSFFSLVLSFNTGAAFSFLAGAGGWQRWMFAAIAIGATVLL